MYPIPLPKPFVPGRDISNGEKIKLKFGEPMKVNLFKICESIQRLQLRCSMKHPNALLIWHSMSRALAKEMPPELFAETHFLWPPEHVKTPGERSLFDLIKDAASIRMDYFKKYGKPEGVLAYGEGKGLDGPGRLRGLHAVMCITNAKLIKMTFEWKDSEEDTNIKEEHEIFMARLKDTLETFDEMRAFIECLNMIERQQSNVQKSNIILTRSDIARILEELKKTDEENKRLFQQVQIARKAIGIPPYVEPPEVVEPSTCPVAEAVADTEVAEEEEEIEENEEIEESDLMVTLTRRQVSLEEYLISRYGRVGEGAKAMGTVMKPCSHLGCPLPPCHYRDWKKDDFKCICGQKFHNLYFLDKHTQRAQEAAWLKCEKCYYKTQRKCCLSKHKKEKHDILKLQMKVSRRLYECQRGCKELFTSKLKLFKHHTETGRKCYYESAAEAPVRQFPKSAASYMEQIIEMFFTSKINQLTANEFKMFCKGFEEDKF